MKRFLAGLHKIVIAPMPEIMFNCVTGPSLSSSELYKYEKSGLYAHFSEKTYLTLCKETALDSVASLLSLVQRSIVCERNVQGKRLIHYITVNIVIVSPL
jgi:hypothetical protein